jgi:hypothetical protein
MTRRLLRVVLVLVGLYAVLFATVLAAMMRPPEQFGTAMRYLPAPLVWGALPAPRMWLWARGGTLSEGDAAPDFTLPQLDNKEERVTLSSHRGQRPVVLVFGSYT